MCIRDRLTPFVLLDFAEEVVERAVRAEVVHEHICKILRMALDELIRLETMGNRNHPGHNAFSH